MATDPDTDKLSTQQGALDSFSESLRDDPSLSPDARETAARVFAEALRKAADQPKKTLAETLSEWKESLFVLHADIQARQKSEEITATDAADLIRRFDGVTEGLEYLARRGEANEGDTTAKDQTSAELPQGMPIDLALALKRGDKG